MHLLGGCRLNAFPYKGTVDLAIRNYSQSLFLSWEREIGLERERGRNLTQVVYSGKSLPSSVKHSASPSPNRNLIQLYTMWVAYCDWFIDK